MGEGKLFISFPSPQGYGSTMKNHPLIRTLLNLRGNPRACVYTEPLWGIPHNLYMPFASVYMAALFLTDQQIGIVASVYALFQALSALLSGAITDKMGRKLSTFVFDVLAWSVPSLLWAISQNFWWFLVAAAFNGLMQVTSNSWICLLIEDAENSALVNIFSLVHISGQLAVIFAPIAGLMVNNLSVVPAMRILYAFTFISMTSKFIILYLYCDETKVGKVRKKETEGISIFKVMSGYGAILKCIFASPGMVLSLAVIAMFSATHLITTNFFGLYATGNLLIPQHMLAYFPIARALIISFFMFGLQRWLFRFSFTNPLLVGIALYAVSLVVLVLAPKENILILFVYILLEACAVSLVMPRKESMTAILIEPSERARISGLITSLSLAVTMPFGVLAGWLSNMDRRLPFLVSICIFTLAFIVIFRSKKLLTHRIDNRE